MTVVNRLVKTTTILRGFVSRAILLLLVVLATGCTGIVSKSPGEETSPPPTEPEVAEPVEQGLVCPEPEPCICPVCVQTPPKIVKVAPSLDGKKVIGEVEMVTVLPENWTYKARIDTGATTTSIHATDIQRFERDGERWVRYTLYHPKTNEPVVKESEQIRRIRIKNAEEGFDRRRVVMMTLALGKITRQVEVSLVDRDDMRYPLLIGRNFLVDTHIVDVSQRYTVN